MLVLSTQSSLGYNAAVDTSTYVSEYTAIHWQGELHGIRWKHAKKKQEVFKGGSVFTIYSNKYIYILGQRIGLKMRYSSKSEGSKSKYGKSQNADVSRE